MLPEIGSLRPWADPTVTSLRRLPMHVPLDRARQLPLDGDWAFELFEHPDDVPESALAGPLGDHAVAVPGNWTMQDTGGLVDLPHYTNVQMPFDGPPPMLPARLVTGVYRRSLRIPRDWGHHRIVLHVGGAESVHAAYVNGRFAGYGTDSRLPSEYDITDLLSAGTEAQVAIVVVRYSAGSYLEDQDQWWMAGLHRSVHVEARPEVHVADVRIDTDYDPLAGSGAVRVAAEVGFTGRPQRGWTVRATLSAPSGRRAGAVRVVAVPHRHDAAYSFTGHVACAEWSLPSARPWSAERPDRYVVTCELVDPSGEVAETVEQRVGLRRIEVRDRQLLLNGQPIWIFGVNRHDHHPDRGAAVSADDMRADLMLMRAHNITAVRTSHYPNDSAFYDLCDELGMYVVDEANIEGHAYNTSICDDPAYRSAFVERGARMVQRDRNHPCIIQWSLGNETGYGANHDALAAWIRSVDPSRPLHYEGAVAHGDPVASTGLRATDAAEAPRRARSAGYPPHWDRGGLRVTDTVCPMYPTIDAIRRYGERGTGSRPLIMCEYSHAMGNSNGSLADYWDVITSTPGLQGGFIWEWKDHGLRQRRPDGVVQLAVGGDFGDAPHDGNFVADGLVSSDGEPHPAMREVAWAYRPVTVTAAAGLRPRLVIANRQSFTGLGGYRLDWELLVDGKVAGHGRLQVPDIAPHSSATLPLPCAVPSAGGEAHLSVRVRTRRPSWFAPAGHLVAWDQVELRAAAMPPSAGARRRAPAASPLDHMLLRPVELCIRRAAVDNDGYKLMPDLSERLGIGGQALRSWRESGVESMPAESLVQHEWHCEPDAGGAVSAVYRHRVVVPDGLADLARVGIRFALPARFADRRWFGRGPHENYPDRSRSAMLGIWHEPPDESPYLVPQEFGLRCDVRWMELACADTGEVLRIERLGAAPLHMSATRHSVERLLAARNEADLVAEDGLIVHVDAAHRGLGTASCGPDVLDRYRLRAGTYRFAYRLTLVDRATRRRTD